ncbi:hypothetical protein JCM8097_007447 [Rhodosporidiobolus ruineniae]
MKVSVALVALTGALAQAASPQPQLYFSPSSLSSSSSSSSPPPSLTAPQANAALAHLLSVSHHLTLPPSSGRTSQDKHWRTLLLDQHVDPSSPRVVLALECPSSGCDDALPSALTHDAAHFQLPALPNHSYLAALSLHLHRLADSLGIDHQQLDSAVVGLRDLVDDGIKSVAGWQGWISTELGSWIGWEPAPKVTNPQKLRPAVEPTLPSSGLLTDLDLAQHPAAKQLVFELEKLSQVADSFGAREGEADVGKQEDGPKVVVLHLKGLKDLAASLSPSSAEYQHALALFRSTLSAFQQSISSLSPSTGFLTLTLPPAPTPLLRKRQPWLKAFETPSDRYSGTKARSKKSALAGVEMNQKVKRSVFVARQSSSAADDDGEEEDLKNQPLVPSSSTCFPSEAQAKNATASCLGRGRVVKGLSLRKTQREAECWVCKCGTTTDRETGRKTRWAGEGCEKEDLSGSFALLAFSSLFLAALGIFSVALLAKVGSAPLPGTLGAVGGNGGHAKRD